MFRRVLLATVLAPLSERRLCFGGLGRHCSLHRTLVWPGEIPKTDSKGNGKLDATFDTQTKELNYTLTFDGLSGPATAAHIHGPANRAQSAGVIAPLGDKNPTSPVSGSVTLTDDQVKMLQSAKLYVNVHTAANPGRRNPRPDRRPESSGRRRPRPRRPHLLRQPPPPPPHLRAAGRRAWLRHHGSAPASLGTGRPARSPVGALHFLL